LAKKTRTPPPPRRVQAPQKRTGRRDKDEQRRRLPLLLAAAGAIAVLAAIVGVALVMGGSSGGVAETMRAAGCTYRDVDAEQNIRPGLRHVEKLPKGFKYNTDPPTSGLHHPTTIIWGMYDSPIAQLNSVHNLEHGGVVIQYGRGVSADAIGQLQAFYRDDPNGLLVASRPRLGNRISLAAWTFDEARLVERGYEGEGRLALCPTFDEGAFGKFVDEYRFMGPERFEPDTLTPGNP
jgi:hypothetical protein